MGHLDCDDVIVLLARTGATLSGREETGLRSHVESCEDCKRLAREVDADEDWRWIARLPNDALDDLDVLMLPMIDPVVFMSVSEIATGGIGRITRAHDRRLGREVAIKEVLDADMRARFEREAMITARLQHPAIVPIYEAGTWPNGSAFYTMRLVSGGTLSHAIDKATTLAARLALLPHVIAVTEALAYAHARKIIHRDLKPQNVLVGEFGETVVIDWGLAKELDREIATPAVGHATIDPTLTRVGSVMGTPCFIAPEQAAGLPLDERADVFALGAILYNVLAGAPPYWDVEHDTDKLIARTQVEAPTPIAMLAPDAPADLRAIVDRAMARSPARRYPSAREMAEELRRFQAGQLIASRQYSLRDLLGRWVKKHRTPVVISSIAALLLAIVAVVAVIDVKRSRDRSQASTAALLEEQGRIELASAERERALTYLAESYRLGRDTIALHHLLAMATRAGNLPSRVLRPSTNGMISNVVYRPDGKLLAFEDDADPRIEVRDGERVVDAFSIGTKIQSTTFSPDATKVLVVGEDYVAAWDVAAKRQLWRSEPWRGVLKATVVFDPSGDAFALSTTTEDHSEIALHDTATGALRASLATAAFNPCVEVAFSADGRYVAACDDHGVQVWDNRTHVPIANLPSKIVRGLAFADGAVVVMDGTQLSLWWFRLDLDIRTQTLGTPSAQFTIVRVSPDGKLVAAGDHDGTVSLWNLDGKLLGSSRELHSEIDALSFSPDSTLLFGAAEEHRAILWNASLHTQAVLRGHDNDFFGGVESASWSPGGHELAVGTRENAVIWNVPHTNLIARFESRQISLGGRELAGSQDDVTVRDVESGKVLEHIAIQPGTAWNGLRPERERLQLSRDDHRVFVMTDARLQMFALPHARRVFDAAIDPHAVTHGFALSRSGDRLAAFLEDRVKVFDTTSGEVVFEHAAPDVGGDLARTGDRVASATPMMISQWSIATGVLRRSEPLFDSVRFPPTDARFDPTGRYLLAFDAATPAVIESATGRTLAHFQTRSRDMYEARFGGPNVAAIGGDDTRLWELATGKLRCVVDGASTAVALSADGQRLAIGYVDGSVRIHDTTCRLLETLGAHSATIDSLAWTDAGDRLVVHSEDGFASIWNVTLDTRSADAIAELARETPWQLVDGMLVAK